MKSRQPLSVSIFNCRDNYSNSRLLTGRFLFAVLCCFVIEAGAATYYVDAINGDDSNPGTSAEPWASFERAMADSGEDTCVVAGDTVNVRDGNYGEVSFNYDPNSYPPVPSSWDDAITYKAQDGHEPNLSKLYIRGMDRHIYLKFEGLHVESNDANNSPLVKVLGGRYLWFKDMYVEGNGALDKYFHQWTAYGIQFDSMRSGGTYYPRHFTVEGCEITNVRFPIDAYDGKEGIVIKDNTVHSYTNSGIRVANYLQDDTALIQGNKIYNQVDVDDPNEEHQPHGSGIATRGWPVTIRGNIIHHAGRTAPLTLYSSRNWDSDMGYRDTNIENNLIYNGHNPYHIRATYTGFGDNVVIKHNTVAPNRYERSGNPEFAILGYAADGNEAKGIEPADVNTWYIYNNNFAGIVDIDGADGMYEGGNIFWDIRNFSLEPNTTSIVVSESNSWEYLKDTVFVGGDDWEYAFTTDRPLLFKESAEINDNFQLAVDSPAIGCANPDHAPVTDILGNPRDDKPDAGCYEYIPDPNNQPPVLEKIGDRTIDENYTLTIEINATDAEGDKITYTARNLPDGATFSGRTFNWRPTYEQAGTYEITFIASDYDHSDSQTITITVNNVNRPPLLKAIGH